jgi:cytochrome b
MSSAGANAMRPNPIAADLYVFGPVLRLLHWALALAILALVATSQLAEAFEHGPYEDAIWNLHILAGYGLAAVLALRVLWGVFGPASARWRDLWHPAVWKAALTTLRLPRSHRAGHDPLASLAYLFAYGVAALMVATGLVLAAAEFGAGPLSGWLGHARWAAGLFKEPHEAGFALMLGFVGLHLAALVFHHLRGERVAQRMLTDRRVPPADPLARQD